MKRSFLIFILIWTLIIPAQISAKQTFAIRQFDTFNLIQNKSFMPNLNGEKAEEYLKENGLYKSLGEAMQAARYSINWLDKSPLPNKKGAFEADNPNNFYSAYFQDDSVHLISKNENDDWRIQMKLKGFGYGKNIFKVSSEKPKVQKDKTRIEIEKLAVSSEQLAVDKTESAIHNPQSAITEWYVNKKEGLEQGWTLNERPQNATNSEKLNLVLEIGGTVEPKLAEDTQSLLLKKQNGKGTIRYEKLKAWDANGKDVPTYMEIFYNELTLKVKEKDAVYPLTIDPIFTQVKRISAPDASDQDQFGFSVSIDGDTAIVGALEGDSTLTNQGAAYIFTRNQGGSDNWGFIKELNSSTSQNFTTFGGSVDISKDTIVIGSANDGLATSSTGLAFVFERNQGGADNWGEVKKLFASDGLSDDSFGSAVSISNDTIVVGANNDDTGSFVNQGSAYIFERNQGGANNWGEVKKITVSDIGESDSFGLTVAIDKDVVVVGAPGNDIAGKQNQGSAYIFKRNQSGADNWGQVSLLTASDGEANDGFGQSVSINIDTLVVGANRSGGRANDNEGAAYIFERNQVGIDSWELVKKIFASDGVNGDGFGVSVSIDNDSVIVGASDFFPSLKGSVYLYQRNQGGSNNWGQVKKLTANDGIAGDSFGLAVAINGNTVVIGAHFDSLNNDTNREGSAYIFRTDNVNWVEVIRQTSSDGTNFDQFGNAVAIYGDTLVVGASNDQINTAQFQGSAYIFTRNKNGADAWGQVAKLTATDGQAGDEFGHSVAICGDTVVVGAYKHDVGGSNTDQGAAYIFERNQGGADGWGQIKKLISSTGTTGDQFGISVSISGDTIVVGADRDEISGNTAQGSANIFHRNQGGADNWGEVKKLIASDGIGGDQFGTAVAISGDTAIVGAPFKDVGVNASQGEAYIYERNQGGVANNWGLVKKIKDQDGDDNDNFGQSVAIDNDTIVVGGPKINSFIQPFDEIGLALVFERNEDGADNWGWVANLSALTVTTNAEFGNSVSIDKDQIIVGAWKEDVGSNTTQGSAYIFERNRGGFNAWGLFKQLTAINGSALDEFGISIVMHRNHVVVGAHRTDIPASFAQKNLKTNKSSLAGTSQGAAFIYRANPLNPTAAGVNVGGKVLSANGRRGLPRTVVTLTDSSGTTKTTRTNQFGYYRFEDITAGETYTITAFLKGYEFETQVINIGESINNLNIRPILNSRSRN